MMLKLWHIDFDAAHPDEFRGYTVVASEKEPSEKLAEEAIAVHGSIYINKISEVTEADIRYVTPKRIIYLDR